VRRCDGGGTHKHTHTHTHAHTHTNTCVCQAHHARAGQEKIRQGALPAAAAAAARGTRDAQIEGTHSTNPPPWQRSQQHAGAAHAMRWGRPGAHTRNARTRKHARRRRASLPACLLRWHAAGAAGRPKQRTRTQRGRHDRHDRHATAARGGSVMQAGRHSRLHHDQVCVGSTKSAWCGVVCWRLPPCLHAHATQPHPAAAAAAVACVVMGQPLVCDKQTQAANTQTCRPTGNTPLPTTNKRAQSTP
jgi:hypothetical protein